VDPVKRSNPQEPLTPDDVAERLDRAAMRVLHILMDIRQTDGLQEQVEQSRYLRGSLEALRAEMDRWAIEPIDPPEFGVGPS
jgi:hypothetical protein